MAMPIMRERIEEDDFYDRKKRSVGQRSNCTA